MCVTVQKKYVPLMFLRAYRAAGLRVNIFFAVPLQAWSGPEGSRKLRFPYFMTTAQESV